MRRPMPWPLRLFMVVSLAMGLFTGFASAAFLVAAAAGDGPYMVQGAVVSRQEFMAFAVPVLVGEIVLCAVSIAVSWGLFRRRYWARRLLLALAVSTFLFAVFAGTAVGLPMAQVGLAMVSGSLALLVLWWMLYRRDDIVDWFEALRPPD